PDPQFLDIVNTIASSGPFINDTNSATNVNAVGVGNPSYTIDDSRNRTNVRTRLLDVQVFTKSKLEFSLNTLATKIALCHPANGGEPTAFGVEIAVGGALAVASSFNGIKALATKLVTVRHEVIVSAGVFQSPQLVTLQLSGIGNATVLQKNGITPIVNLPGVGNNHQDHDVIATVWNMKVNFTLLNDCTFLYTPGTDPGLATWEEHLRFRPGPIHHHGQQHTCVTEPDLFKYWLPADFRGFSRGFAQELAVTHNALTAVVLKSHPSSRGVVTLTGSNPQDPLHIEKHHFEAADGQSDINA
ncbi:hypothetical protein C8R44DRAFT_601832, partial [Mycena epipterygia]